jgi:ribonuclease P protein component
MPDARAAASASAPNATWVAPRLVPMDRLKRRADFLAAASGAKSSTGAFMLQVRGRGDQGPARVGFTVSKKVGGAVERNRVRRRLRELVRVSFAERLQAGTDYVLIGRRAALDLPFDQLIEDFADALGRLHEIGAKSASRCESAGAHARQIRGGQNAS